MAHKAEIQSKLGARGSSGKKVEQIGALWRRRYAVRSVARVNLHHNQRKKKVFCAGPIRLQLLWVVG